MEKQLEPRLIRLSTRLGLARFFAPLTRLPRMENAFILLLLLTLMPGPLVWLGFYEGHNFLIAIILYAGLCCTTPSLVFSRLLKQPIDSHPFQIQAKQLPRLVIKILLMNLVVLGGWYLNKATLIDWPHFMRHADAIGIHTDLSFWILATYFVTINPIVEEIFWRGLVYQQLKVHFTRPIALVVSSFLFGLWHWVIIQHFFVPHWQAPLTLLIMIGGVSFSRAFERTGSLTNAIIFHGFGADLPIMLILWDCLHIARHNF